MVQLQSKNSLGTQTCKHLFPWLTILPWGISFESLRVLKVPKLNTCISINRLGLWCDPRKQQRNSGPVWFWFFLSSTELIPISNRKYLLKKKTSGGNFPWGHKILNQIFNLKKKLSLSQQSSIKRTHVRIGAHKKPYITLNICFSSYASLARIKFATHDYCWHSRLMPRNVFTTTHCHLLYNITYVCLYVYTYMHTQSKKSCAINKKIKRK